MAIQIRHFNGNDFTQSCKVINDLFQFFPPYEKDKDFIKFYGNIAGIEAFFKLPRQCKEIDSLKFGIGSFIQYFPNEVDDNGTTRHLISRACYYFNSIHIHSLRQPCKSLESLRISNNLLIYGFPGYNCDREPFTFNLEPTLKDDPEFITKLKQVSKVDKNNLDTS